MNSYFLAFDHRGAFAKAVLEVDKPTAEQARTITSCKALIGAAAMAAAPRLRDARVGILVDELYGGEIANSALESGLLVAMPVEKPDLEIFDFAYGENYREHIQAFQPDYAKVLVRYNVDGDAKGNRVQAGRLAELSAWLKAQHYKLLFELIVEPTSGQLEASGGDRAEFERELRPALIRDAIAELQAAGIEPEIWKLEGIDWADDARRVVSQIRNTPWRQEVECTVLGAGASADRVDTWLRTAAAVEGYSGFAVGRSIWKAPLQEFVAGECSPEEAVETITANYLRFVDVYESAAVGA
ncbi:MAG: DUF2090 domain-containing protein [Actinobacteria bacterium]|nr:DUF2090 domain-containing protein [Actinomycetota bacterium]